ncbi:MAG: surface-adhesin E family protein [Parachlamydiaceae bacterium]
MKKFAMPLKALSNLFLGKKLFDIIFIMCAIFPAVAYSQLRSSSTLSGGEAASFQDGFQQEGKDIVSERAKVLQQLTTIGNEAAVVGISYEFSEWKRLAVELAGGIFSVYTPTDGTLLMVLKVQNAKAEMARKNASDKTDSSLIQRRSNIHDSKTTESFESNYWKKIYTGQSLGQAQRDLYIDPVSLQSMDALVKIWSVDDFSTEQENQGKKYFSIVRFSEIDCNSYRIRILELAVYDQRMGVGKVVYADDKPKQWNAVILDGRAIASLFKFACKR